LIRRGGYILSEAKVPKLILIATGSEVGLALGAQKVLAEQGVEARVVSMPCTSSFERQSAEYREGVLPSSCRKRVAVEAGVTVLWSKYVGLDGKVVGIDRFGLS
ncbi:transketolase-like TK C-terminal-containing protein, partial [Klebsiella pneumoniae]|uniref:transketolase-like TK C-terminal-containing protein n=1 Tax=Klebsiella pneumoniae TaxID=573 RepID=UPI0027D329D9